MSEETYTYSLEAPVEDAPATVVSLVPSITESMFDLNLGNRLIGRTEYCIYPADKVDMIPALGGTKNPDVERIISMKPGLVMANFEENRKQDVEAIQAAGIPVWVTFPRTIQEALNLLWNIMYLFDETSMVMRVRLIEQVNDRLRNLAEAREQDEGLPKVFVPIWYETLAASDNPSKPDSYLMTANKDTYLNDVLYTCGAENVFAHRERLYPLKADLGEAESLAADDPRIEGRDTRYPRITLEEVEKAQPDVILLPSEPFQFTEKHIALFKNLDVPAAKHDRIHLIDGSLLTWHGTRVAYALDQLPILFRLG
jgi:ABC-type Fe3+-hydroxamate transport system substrate-binding protein